MNQDPWADEIREQKLVISLEWLIVHAQRFWGPEVVYNPQRWRTTDGYIPYQTLQMYWLGAVSLMAFERYSAAKAQHMAERSEAGARLSQEQLLVAFPDREGL